MVIKTTKVLYEPLASENNQASVFPGKWRRTGVII